MPAVIPDDRAGVALVLFLSPLPGPADGSAGFGDELERSKGWWKEEDSSARVVREGMLYGMYVL